MQNLNNDLLELVNSHISISDKFSDKSLFLDQLDFLSFWVDVDKMAQNWPYDTNPFRDNPNWEKSIYDNVYQLVEEDKIVLQYVKEGYSPVAILQWFKMKIKDKGDQRKISVYGKGLRLYYCGFLDWLPDYINLYAGDVIRADICWDTMDKIPAQVVDLDNSVTYGDEENRTYKGFGNKRSPLFIRIYDKTLDLAKDHNSMAWLYPERYTTSCWRIECKFTGRYAQSMTALQWLGVVDRGGSIQKPKNIKRDFLRSAFYNLIMYIDYIPDKKQQFNLLSSISSMCSKKMGKLKDFISVNDLNEDD